MDILPDRFWQLVAKYNVSVFWTGNGSVQNLKLPRIKRDQFLAFIRAVREGRRAQVAYYGNNNELLRLCK